MQTSVQPSWPVIQEYSGLVELAAKNADPDYWEWDDRSRAVWELAPEHWQRFNAKWYGATDSQCPSLADPRSPSLSLELLPLYCDGSLPTILVRESYVTMFDHVWAQAMSSEGMTGVIVTGQPGTGKTLFQYYLLVRLLRYKQVVLFSLDGVSLYIFYRDEVYTAALAAVQLGVKLPKPRSSSSKVFIWSLFDIRGEKEPDMFLVQPPCLPVQTAPPGPSRYKTWDKELTPLLTALPLWTHNELMQALPYQKKYNSLLGALHNDYDGSSQNQSDPLDKFPGSRALLEECEELPLPEDAMDYLLKAAIDRFGYSARDVFSAVFDYCGTTGRHQDAFRIEYADLKAAVSALLNNQSANYSISHRILALCPVYRGPFQRVNWTVNFKSDWVARNVVQELDKAKDFEIRQYINFFRLIPEAQTMVGWCLEPFAHRSIAETSTGGFWPLINMVSNDADTPRFTVARGASSRVPDDVQFAKVKRKIVELQSTADLSTCPENGMYYVHENPNFPLFDAFTIELDRSKKCAILWVLQITTSRLHGGSAKGYQKIRDIIAGLKDQLESDPPKKKTKMAAGKTASKPLVQVRYLFVVPKGDSQKMQWHFPKGWSENWDRNDHRGGVYCLEIPLA